MRSILGWYFSSLCASACENPHFTNHNHHSALFLVLFLLVRSHFQECPPCAQFSQTANEAESLPGGLQALWIFSLQMQILNASLEWPHLETVLQGGKQSDVYGKEQNKNLPLTSVLVGFGADLKWFFLFSMFFCSSLELLFPHPSPFKFPVVRWERDSAFQPGQIRSLMGISHEVQIYLGDVHCPAWPAGCHLIT